MSVLTRLFGTKFNDEQLAAQARVAVSEDPLLRNPSEVVVESARGVITLTGKVGRENDRARVEGVVRSALRTTGIKYDQIVNTIQVVE